MSRPAVRVIGRYALHQEIASGGMATVHFGRLLGPVGFARTVAIKRLHPQFAKDPEFVSMFLDEARLAARIRHPNVVQTLDVVALEGELFIVMDYVQGESLSRLIKASRKLGVPIPPRIVVGVMTAALHGLHAAHEAKNERGEPLNIVHRDVSPQNILVGVDGVSRVLDFGVAKAAGRLQTTREGQLKGKLPYMAPEHIRGQVTRQTDVYAAGLVIWEALTGRRVFTADDEASLIGKVIAAEVEPPSRHAPHLGDAFDAVVLRALDREPANRPATARQLAAELERCMAPAQQMEIGEWVEKLAHASIAQRAQTIAELESISSVVDVPAGASLAEEPASSADSSAPKSVDAPLSERSDAKGSQISSISVSKPGEPAPAASGGRRLALTAFAAVALVVGGGLGTAFFLRGAGGGAPATVAAPLPPSTPSSAPAPSAPAPSAPARVGGDPQTPATGVPTASAAPEATSAPAAEPSATAFASGYDAARTPPSAAASKAAGRTKPVAAPSRPASQVSCDPPYTIDPASPTVKHWKPECVGR